MIVEKKGGSVSFNPEVIIITCPDHPADIWRNCGSEDVEQLLRRIEIIKYFPCGEHPNSVLYRDVRKEVNAAIIFRN